MTANPDVVQALIGLATVGIDLTLLMVVWARRECHEKWVKRCGGRG